MGIFFLILSLIFIVLSLLPFSKNQHWIFRVPDFIKLQLLALQLIAVLGLIIYDQSRVWFWPLVSMQLILIGYHIYLFIPFMRSCKKQSSGNASGQELSIISANIFMHNKDYGRFKACIKREDPDVFVTIESNKDWEVALKDLETDYKYTNKIPLENTYGMHLYAKIPFKKIETHYFVADDLPCMEAHFTTTQGLEFVLFCAHPPPPSPTEEVNSKERDGDLMSLAKRIAKINKPTLVIGDFNTVTWSRISVLFRKKSGLQDARYGRGILATYHAKYWFFRAPLDLVYHSKALVITKLNVLENIGSDHFPISCKFRVNAQVSNELIQDESISSKVAKEAEQFIKDGKKQQSENRRS